MCKKEEFDSDPFSRVDYRRFISWSQRIEREAPFLKSVLEESPSKQVLDLGCGTGEHSRFFNSLGCTATGIDRSESMINKAREAPVPEGVRFILGDIRDLPTYVSPGFGLAISLGNTLPAILEDQDLEKFLAGLFAVIEPGGLVLVQILNYRRIFSQGIRHLPLNFRDSGEGSTIFLRLMRALSKGRVEFCPSTLVYDPDQEPPLKVTKSQVITLRGWQESELQGRLEASGFKVLALFGDMTRGPFDPDQSHDLVILSQR